MGQRSDRDPREHHYSFAYVALRSMAFRDPAQLFAVVASDGPRFLQWLWGKVGQQLEAEAVGTLAHTFVAPAALTIGEAKALVVTLPTPAAAAECWFVALVLPPDGALAYYTLELGARMDGEPRTVLCGWTADGIHRNYGDGPAPTIEAFAQALERLIAPRVLH